MSASQLSGPALDECSAWQKVTLKFDPTGGNEQTFLLTSGGVDGAKQIYFLGADMITVAGAHRDLRLHFPGSSLNYRPSITGGIGMNGGNDGVHFVLPADGHLDLSTPIPLLADDALGGKIQQITCALSRHDGSAPTYTELYVHLAVTRERRNNPRNDYSYIGETPYRGARFQAMNQF